MIKYSFCLFLLSLTGCTNDQKETPTIFAGEIVNPKSDMVVLYKDDVVIDSAQLDMHNRFSIKLDTLEEGLYNFHNSDQYQYVYLSKGDSLLVRLNTIYFDESLVFSGIGEEINNFLIEIFLNNEEEESLIESYYDLEPEPFSDKIDSLRQIKLNLLNDLQSEIELSPKSLIIANSSIDYSSYIYKEKYPFKHLRKTSKSTIPKLSDDFYEYRDHLNFDDEDLTYFIPYYDFMKRHFDNLAYTDCVVDCENGGQVIKDQLHFNRHKLKLIDSIVKEKKLRDNLFRNVALTYFLKVHDNIENNKIFLDDFHKLSSNNKHISEIHVLYDGVIKMQPNNSLPDIKVLDSIGNPISLKKIAEDSDNVVVYFWTDANPRHFINVTNEVSKLSDAHPETTFIGISLTPQDESWKAIIHSNNKNFNNQYRAENINDLRSALIVDGLNKAILLKDGLIVDAYKNIFTLF
tara:strand:- start:74483 stop:75865 length:1383 start_codon:yes stop_codon:yes gene_type:complete